MAIVGRESFADIVLPFPPVSSRHASLEPLGAGRYRVVDLGSANGTFVSGRRVETSDVREGEDLRFGSVSFDWAAHRASLDADLALPRGMTLGRDPSCDLVVSDARVSSRHLRVIPQGIGHLLVDLGSANGLFVNGRPVSRAVVGPSDEVRLGTLRVDLPGLVARRAAPWPATFPASPPAELAAPMPPAATPVFVTMPAPPLTPPAAEAPRRSGGRGWAWAAAVVLVLGLGGTGVAFATREDVVKKCALGEEDAYRESAVFLWDVKEARARAEAHTWCPRHAEEPVTYTKRTKCTSCGKVYREVKLVAPRRENPRDVEVAEGTCSDACLFNQDVRDAGAGIKDLAGQAIGALFR
jgi:pSer/pThr/pTyr-binding forkhead associated (FHA) protein